MRSATESLSSVSFIAIMHLEEQSVLPPAKNKPSRLRMENQAIEMISTEYNFYY